jgi:RNA 2',3'-cyclic 3'-phosphodiesterase
MRTFVAVEVHNDNVLNSIAKLQSDLQIRATPVSKQNMHFTLLFLGEISEETAEAVKGALSGIVFKPIDLSFTHLGAFPNPNFPRVIWIGTDEGSAKELVDLASQVEQNLAPLGFKSDRPFKPHLTIFRIKNKADDISKKIERFKVVDLGKDVISELKFKQSVLTPSGPVYSDLKVIKAQ